jgi:hypothetical protein
MAPMPNIEFHCLDKVVATYNHIAEAYAIDKTLSSDPYLAEALRKDPLRMQRELEKLDPCYDELMPIVALYNEAAAAIRSHQVQSTGLFRFTPTTKDAIINDDAAWYVVSSCTYPWRMKTDKWLATTSIIKSYCPGSLVDSMCQNTIKPSMRFFALEVVGLRKTDMPETVRQRFRPFVGDPFVFIAQHRTAEEEQTTVDISALKTSLANLRTTVVKLTHPAAISTTTAVTKPIAVAVVPSASVSDEPVSSASGSWWSGINLSVVGLLLVLTVVELALLLRRRFRL